MGRVKISDNSIWLKHIEGDLGLVHRLERLKSGQTIDLEVDGVVGRWERMRDGRDGRPTPGIKPIDAMREVWTRLQADRGRVVEMRELVGDSYLASLVPLLSEWDSPEDEEACRDL